MSPVPIIVPADPIDRDIGFMPTRAPYDPRWMLEGREGPGDGSWQTGFFDKDSWDEIMRPWAQTVITGLYLFYYTDVFWELNYVRVYCLNFQEGLAWVVFQSV